MKRLESIEQIKVGSFLKIEGKTDKNSYKRISVKIIKKCEDLSGNIWYEVIINKTKNRYFNFDMYLSGKSWAKNIFLLDGLDDG